MSLAEQFHRDGWARLPHVVRNTDLESVIDALRARGSGLAGSEERLLDGWRRHDAVRRLASAPEILRLVADLVGGRPIPFQTLNFRRGTEQRFHADTIHFDSLPSGRMCAVWVALEDVGADQGPVRLVPGSHLLPPLRPAEALDASGRFDYSRYEDLVAARVEGLPVEDFHAVAGECLVWHANLVHGGAPVTGAGSRWSQVTHHFVEGATYITPMDSDFASQEYRVRVPLVDISTGATVEHRIDGRPARFVHLRSGRSRILRESDPEPPAILRMASAVRAAEFRMRWRLSPAIDRARSAAERRGRTE